MAKSNPRIERERKTLKIMVRIFCRDRHDTKGEFCSGCKEVFDYAIKRLDKCSIGKDKPACVRCPIHCYRPEMKEQIREVMRHSGPRMIWRHPILAARHVIDGRHEAPALPGTEGRTANKP